MAPATQKRLLTLVKLGDRQFFLLIHIQFTSLTFLYIFHFIYSVILHFSVNSRSTNP